jgi:hypothetical protein
MNQESEFDLVTLYEVSWDGEGYRPSAPVRWTRDEGQVGDEWQFGYSYTGETVVVDDERAEWLEEV